MIYFGGIIGLFQMTLLPGLLVTSILRFRSNSFLQNIIYIFGLSLVANYAAVFVLTSVGLYLPWVVYCLIFIECAVLVYRYRQVLRSTCDQSAGNSLARLKQWGIEVSGKTTDSTANLGVIRFGLLLLILVLIYLAFDALKWYFGFLYKEFWGVFKFWDAVVSWNPWAIQWASNIFPHTMIYPQFNSRDWSITYILMGNQTVQLFAKSIMPLFPFVTLLMFLDLALSERSFGALVGLVVARYMIKKFLGEYIAEGYVDTALMFFGFLTIYNLIKLQHISDTAEQVRQIIAGVIFASGAALTKQGGLYMLLVYPILVLVIWHLEVPVDARQLRRTLWRAMLTAFVFVMSWYLIAIYWIRTGVQDSSLGWIAWIGDRTLWERLVWTFSNLGRYRFVFLAVIIGLPLYPKFYRWLVGIVLVPYSLMWGLFVGYEVRNVALIFPLLCLLFGMLLERLVRIGLEVIQRLHLGRIPVGAVVILLTTAILAVTLWLPGQSLVAEQLEMQKKVIFPELNDKIYAALETRPAGITLISSYPVFSLPGLNINFIFDTMDSYDVFLANLDQESW